MEWITANLHILPKISPNASGWRLQGFPTVLELAVSQSDVVRLFTGHNWGEQHPKCHFCKTWVGNSSMERTSGNVGIKKSTRSYIKRMWKPKSCCIVTIPTCSVVRVQTRICFIHVGQGYLYWYTRCNLPPYHACLAIFNISHNYKVMT